MIREIPADAERLALISTGHCESVHEWIERDGRRQPADDQMRDEASGLPMWTVHCLAPGADRPELIAVRVPARECPQPKPYEPVAFERLVVRVSVNRSTGVLGGYWSAAGLADPRRQGKPHQGEQQQAA